MTTKRRDTSIPQFSISAEEVAYETFLKEASRRMGQLRLNTAEILFSSDMASHLRKALLAKHPKKGKLHELELPIDGRSEPVTVEPLISNAFKVERKNKIPPSLPPPRKR